MSQLLYELKVAVLDGLYSGVYLVSALGVLILSACVFVGFVEYVKRLL